LKTGNRENGFFVEILTGIANTVFIRVPYDVEKVGAVNDMVSYGRGAAHGKDKSVVSLCS
jgi:hypothetical protein